MALFWCVVVIVLIFLIGVIIETLLDTNNYLNEIDKTIKEIRNDIKIK